MLTIALTVALSAVNPTAAFTPKVRPYDAQHYRIDFKLLEDGSFENKATITIKGKSTVSSIELDARGLEVKSVTVDGADAPFTLKADPALNTGTLTIKPPKAIAAGKEGTVVVLYKGRAGQAHAGLFEVTDEQGTWYFTQFQTTHARAFFPCNDQPDDKATTEIFAIVDHKMKVLSNGRKELDETFSEGGKNLRRVHWKQDQPHSTYLVALAIGEFEAVPTGGDLPSTVWVRPGSQDRAYAAVDAMRQSVNFQANYLGVKYPWARLDAVSVPHFYWSGMENTSLVFERENKLVVEHKNDQYARSVIAQVLAHEIAHQWFGDYVTLKWWDDTWLNEGFATWLGDKTADANFDNDMIEVQRIHELYTSYFRTEDGPKSHPLVGKGAPSPEEVFDDISYGKGAQVLRMLELWIGADLMKKSLKAYLEKYAFANATSADFFKVVGDTTKKAPELKAFQEAWLKKKGYPVIYPDITFSGGEAVIRIRQQPSRGDEKGPWAFKLPIVISRANEPKYTKEVVITVDKPEVTMKVELPGAPQWVNWNKDAAALVRVNGPSVSEEQWVDAARYDPDPTWRTLAAWTLAGEMVALEPKSEGIPSDAAMGAIRDVLTKDPSPYVRESLLARLAATRWKKLPAALGPIALEQAKRPQGMVEDTIGRIAVGRSAREVLGKIDWADGHKFLIDEISRKDPDLNYLQSLARGTANIGTPVALATLRAAVGNQKARGEMYYRRTVLALPTYPGLDMLAPLKEVVKENGNNSELVRLLFLGLGDNTTVRASPEAAALVRDLVLDEKTLGEDLRADILSVLDEVKTKDAKDALSVVAEKATSKRLAGLAKQVLEANFSGPAAKAPKK